MTNEEQTKMINDFAQQLVEEAAKQGKLILAGWLALKLQAARGGATKQQLENLRMAYYAGAEHLFSSLMNIMDPNEEITNADMEKMGLISNELQAWREEVQKELADMEKANATSQ